MAQPLCRSAADQQQAKTLYEQALAQPGSPEAVSKLRESVAACPLFQNNAQLAYTLLELARYPEAEAAANDAVKLAATPENEIKGWWLVAQARQGGNRWMEAKAAYSAALQKVTGQPPRWLLDSYVAFEEELGARGALPAAAIVRTLGAVRATGAVPRIELRISFDYDSSRLTAAGRTQVRELARALMHPVLRDYPVRVIGHADERGGAAYNRDLSARRAQAVTVALTQLEAGLSGRLQWEGKGEAELRVLQAQTEAEHAVNRRVEVELGGRP